MSFPHKQIPNCQLELGIFVRSTLLNQQVLLKLILHPFAMRFLSANSAYLLIQLNNSTILHFSHNFQIYEGIPDESIYCITGVIRYILEDKFHDFVFSGQYN